MEGESEVRVRPGKVHELWGLRAVVNAGVKSSGGFVGIYSCVSVCSKFGPQPPPISGRNCSVLVCFPATVRFRHVILVPDLFAQVSALTIQELLENYLGTRALHWFWGISSHAGYHRALFKSWYVALEKRGQVI